jgi:NitT/TauT family transport system permease protein
MSKLSKLELRTVSHNFSAEGAAESPVLKDISIAVPDQRFISILGPSGCGKSTLFNIIAGLFAPTQGEVHLDQRNITGMVGHVGYMLQKDLLLPWRTVVDNTILGMELQGVPKEQARALARPYLERYGLGGFEERYPGVLSGGMRQRTALLRTLLYQSEVILLDEPFAALDAQTRADMQEWLLSIWSELRKTVIFVTHDIEEAIFLSDQIYVMSSRPGKIKTVIDVPIPRPRPRSCASDPIFLEIKQRCIDLLAAERRELAGVGARPEPMRETAPPPIRLNLQQNAAPRGRVLKTPTVWPTWKVACLQFAIVVGMLGLWEVSAQVGWLDGFFWSFPSKIFDSFKSFVATGQAYADTWFTFKSTLLGFVFGTLSGASIGLSYWWSRNYAAVAQPFLICFEATPKLALAPLIVLVFGIGMASKVVLGIALTVVVTALTTYTAVRAIDPDSERLMYSLGATNWQVFRKLVVPSTLPWIISLLRVNIGLALTGAVLGEFISSEHGLGRQILYASQIYDISLIWVAVAILASLSILMYAAIGQLEKFLLKGLMHGAGRG